MDITNDPAKNKINRQKHQIDLADIEGVFTMTALLLLKTEIMPKSTFYRWAWMASAACWWWLTTTGARIKSVLFPRAWPNLTSGALTKRSKP